MKKILMMAAATVFVVSMAGSAMAVDATVNATVQNKCGAITPGTLTLDIDPAAAANSTGSASTVQCTNGRLMTVSAESTNAGAGSLTATSPLTGTLKVGAKTITYSLAFLDSFTGAGFGGASPTTLIAGTGASVTAANAAAALADPGTYSDTVTLTITY